GLSRISVKTVTSTAMTPDDRQRNGTSPAGVRPDCRDPAGGAVGLGRLGQPPRQRSVGFTVAVGRRFTVGTETALQSLGGQFGSHAVKVGAQSDLSAERGGTATRPVDEIPLVDS